MRALRPIFAVIFCGHFFWLFSAGVRGSYCNGGQSKPGDPPLPNINVTAFTIEYQINILDQQYTMWVREDYDYKSNKVKVTMLKDGLEEGIFLDYNDNLIMQYSYKQPDKSTYTCTVTELNSTNTDNFDVFGGRSMDDKGQQHIYSSSQVFRFSANLGEAYMGIAVIDGMITDHWQSCMFWADDLDNFTLDYYFTRSDWTPVDFISPVQIPVRAVITGIKTNGNSVTQLNHIYEYLNFRVYSRLPEENFALPLNMKCEDTKGLRKKPLPNLPDRLSYTLEIVQNDMRVLNVLYDESRKLVRTFEKRVISIDDFNTGVHYSINITNNSCTVRPVDQALDFDAVVSRNYTKLKSRQELFYLDGDFTYTGQVDRRGIKCDAWLRTMVMDGQNQKVEVFFSIPNQKFTNPLDTQKLVSMTVTRDDGALTWYNLFNQEANPDMAENPFDITACKQDSSMLQFHMTLTFQPAGVFTVQKYQSLLHDVLSQAMVNASGVQPLQVQWSEIEWSETTSEMYWYGSLLVPEPLSVRAMLAMSETIVSIDKAWFKLQNYINLGLFIVTVLLPSDASNKETIVTLTAVQLKNTSSDVDNNITDDDEDNSLSHFIVNENSNIPNLEPERSLTVTGPSDCADLCLQQSQFECSIFTFCAQSNQCQLSSKPPVIISSSDSAGCDIYFRDYTADFMKSPERVIAPTDVAASERMATVEICATLCAHQTNVRCQYFIFCEFNKQCYVSSNRTSPTFADTNSISLSCDYYPRTYVSDYTINAASALQADALSEEEVTTVNYTTAEGCAHLCTKLVSGCYGFSYCKSQQQCQLVRGFAVAKIKTVTNKECAVYELKPGLPFQGINVTIDTRTDEVTQYSAGALAGLGVAMAVVGILLCSVAVFLLRRYNVWNPF